MQILSSDSESQSANVPDSGGTSRKDDSSDVAEARDMILQDIECSSAGTTSTRAKKSSSTTVTHIVPFNMQRTKTVVLHPPSPADSYQTHRGTDQGFHASDFLSSTRKSVSTRRSLALPRKSDVVSNPPITSTPPMNGRPTTTYARKFVMDIAQYDYNMYSRQPVNTQPPPPRSPSYDTRAKHVRRATHVSGSPVVSTQKKSIGLSRTSAPAAVGSNSKPSDLNITGEKTTQRQNGPTRLTGIHRESIDNSMIGHVIGTEPPKKMPLHPPQKALSKADILVVPTGNYKTQRSPADMTPVSDLPNGSLALPVISPPLVPPR